MDRWKAIRRGRIYCAPACGGQCTWDAYVKAKNGAERLRKQLGRGWETEVFENRGWHYGATHEGNRLSVSHSAHSPGFMTILAGQWVGHGKTGQKSIDEAIQAALPELPGLKAIVACIEALRPPATRSRI